MPFSTTACPKRFKILPIVTLLLGLCLFRPGWAYAESSTAGHAAPQITSEQAKQLVSLLSNDAKRREFLATLQTLVQAQSSQALANTGDTTHSQLKPDGLGAEILGSAGDWGRAASVQAHTLLRTVVDVGAIGPWWHLMRSDAAARYETLKLLLRAVILVAMSVVLFLGICFALRGPRCRIENFARLKGRSAHQQEVEDRQAAYDAADREANAEHATQTVEDEETHQKERISRLRHQGALSRLLLVLRRVPYALLCLVLDCFPILVVPLVALLIVVLDPAGDEYTVALLRALSLTALVSGGLIICIRAIIAPRHPWLRLTLLSDSLSVFLFDWLRLLVMTAGISAAVLETLEDCGLPNPVIVALLKIVTLMLHLMVAVMIMRSRSRVMRFCHRNGETGLSTNLLHLFGRIWWVIALFFDLGLWLVWAAEIHHGYAVIWTGFLRSVVALIGIRLVSIVLYGLLERVFRAAPSWAALSEDTQTRFSRYYAPAQRVIAVIITVLTVLALANAWGAPIRALFSVGGIGYKLLSSSMTVLIACLLSALVWEASNIMLERYARKMGSFDDGGARVARIRTLQPMIRITLMVVLVAVIGLTILSEIGVNVAPLLAGASIFGVALGFGSQKLVQDFINGIFLLMENALTVGDAVTLNGTYGVVEHLSLRTVHVRANDGSMNIFPFSSLGQIINYNRDFARAIIVAEVGYDADTDEVVKVIHDITAEMRADENFSALIIDNFQMWGVDALNQTSVTVRGTLPTVTAGRWPVQREFYRRLKKTFEARGIHLPYPTRFVEVAGLTGLSTSENHTTTPKSDHMPDATGKGEVGV